jgi:hypothetical protein
VTHCKRVLILEGADGSGKSTLAVELAKELGAMVVHHGPYKEVTDPAELAGRYIDSMLPALLGEKHVILDRSWLSEPIYGRAFRDGVDRLGPIITLQLERLAMRCGAHVVLCDPGWEHVSASWAKRKGEEYLKTSAQLYQVYTDYYGLRSRTQLPVADYDLRTPDLEPDGLAYLQPHRLDVLSAGNLDGRVVLVGDSMKLGSHPYQWPFGDLDDQSTSHWLTEQLRLEGIHERHLLWVSTDNDLGWLRGVERPVVALGLTALARLAAEGVDAAAQVPHPRLHKRINHPARYVLLDVLKRLL